MTRNPPAPAQSRQPSRPQRRYRVESSSSSRKYAHIRASNRDAVQPTSFAAEFEPVVIGLHLLLQRNLRIFNRNKRHMIRIVGLFYVSSMASNQVRERSALPPADKVLVLLHQSHSTTGRVGRILRSLGYALDIRFPLSGDELPLSLDRHAGVVVFGGPMSANDNDALLRHEIDWLETPLRQDKPFLGLCLGAQMMARKLGARVYRPASQMSELGYHHIRPTPAADGICSARFPRCVYQWHSDGFDIPHGASRLAEGDGDFPNQAFLYAGNTVGLQFHPEVTYQMMCRWTTRGAARLGENAAPPRQVHLDGWFLYDDAVDKWIAAFLRVWARDELIWRRSNSRGAAYPIAAE